MRTDTQNNYICNYLIKIDLKEKDMLKSSLLHQHCITITEIIKGLYSVCHKE